MWLTARPVDRAGVKRNHRNCSGAYERDGNSGSSEHRRAGGKSCWPAQRTQAQDDICLQIADDSLRRGATTMVDRGCVRLIATCVGCVHGALIVWNTAIDTALPVEM